MIIINLYLANNDKVSNVYLITNTKHQPQYMLSGRFGIKNSGFTLYNLNNQMLGTITQQNTNIFPYFILRTSQCNAKLFHYRLINNFGYLTKFQWFIIEHQHHYYVYHFQQKVMMIHTIATIYGSSLHIQITNQSDINTCLLLASAINSWQQLRVQRHYRLKLRNNCYVN